MPEGSSRAARPSERSADRLEGLAALGSGRFGPFRVPLPLLIDTSGNGAGLHLEVGEPERPGHRRVVVRDRALRWDLTFPIPAPEITGTSGFFHEVAPAAVLARAPLGSDLTTRLAASRPAVIVLLNARTLYADGDSFIHAIRELRIAAGPASILWCPRTALPHRLALLTYLGVDVLDMTAASFAATEGVYLDANLGSLPEGPARVEQNCPCPGCARDGSVDLTLHAHATMRDEWHRVRAALRAGRLRELVEARLPAEPHAAELLRYADRILAESLEGSAPVVGPSAPRYVLTESHRRPEVVRFRQRLLDRYRPPPSKRVLLVVPCSETKPYRHSPSHRRFARAIETVPHLERLHLASVTSPLGVVPRELEDVYPIRHYDIPVTGDWSDLEQRAVRTALEHLLSTGGYTDVIFHLDRAEYSFLADASPLARPAIWTVEGDRAGSPASLEQLRTAVAAALAVSAPVPGGPLTVVKEELRAVAAFQFGPEGARLLFADPLRLAGRPWFQRLTDGRGTDLATWREERGLFHLTVAGGRRLLPLHGYDVEMDPAVELAGDLFAPGVKRADPRIRMGDAVVVTRSGSLTGVGEATLPGPWMTELSHGLAVKVRHRTHAQEDVAAPRPKIE
ncbi:MAG: DUF5591 domain-containing protein [Thermoplasmata archaeon]